MPLSHLPAPVATCFQRLGTALDARSAARFKARGRRRKGP